MIYKNKEVEVMRIQSDADFNRYGIIDFYWPEARGFLIGSSNNCLFLMFFRAKSILDDGKFVMVYIDGQSHDKYVNLSRIEIVPNIWMQNIIRRMVKRL